MMEIFFLTSWTIFCILIIYISFGISDFISEINHYKTRINFLEIDKFSLNAKIREAEHYLKEMNFRNRELESRIKKFNEKAFSKWFKEFKEWDDMIWNITLPPDLI